MIKGNKYIIIAGLIFWFSNTLFLFQIAKVNEEGRISERVNTPDKIIQKNNKIALTDTENKSSFVIIIDDIGKEIDSLKELSKINLPFTISILPFQKYSKEAAYIAKRNGWEIMIHLPMEPINYPEKNPGHKALMLNMSPDELRNVFNEIYDNIPFAVGFNNHMGSKFTKDENKLQIIMEVAKKKQLYFIDSKTTLNSKAFKVAINNGLVAAERTLFLDNIIDENMIKEKLIELINISNNDNIAIGICHTYPETKRVLAQLPYLLTQHDKKLVHASKLLNSKSNIIYIASLLNKENN